MAARVCKPCELSFPSGPLHIACTVCGKGTLLDALATPPDDWEVQARVKRQEREGEIVEDVDDQVVGWRVERLTEDHGLEWDYATRLASMRGDEGGYALDLHRLDALVAAGCPFDTALRILL